MEEVTMARYCENKKCKTPLFPDEVEFCAACVQVANRVTAYPKKG